MATKLAFIVPFALSLTFLVSFGYSDSSQTCIQVRTKFPASESDLLNLLVTVGNRALDNPNLNPSVEDYENTQTSRPEKGMGLDKFQFKRAFNLSTSEVNDIDT